MGDNLEKAQVMGAATYWRDADAPLMQTCWDEALEAEIDAYWNERAESYSNGVCGELRDARHEAWRCALERIAADPSEKAAHENRVLRVLDLGCGPGFFSILFAQMGASVDAVDASEEMLDHALCNAREQGCDQRVAFHQGDVTTLPFENGSFDVVVSRNLTWLMRNPEAAYVEWLRVLRPGGKLAVFDANWYLYLADPLIDAQRRADQEGKRVLEWGEDACATTTEEQRCEEIAEELPLTPVVRPDWDVEVLQSLGAMQVSADEGVWRELWTESEQAFYASSPLFLVEAVKA